VVSAAVVVVSAAVVVVGAGVVVVASAVGITAKLFAELMTVLITLGVSGVEGGRFIVISIIRRSPSPRKF